MYEIGLASEVVLNPHFINVNTAQKILIGLVPHGGRKHSLITSLSGVEADIYIVIRSRCLLSLCIH